MINILYIGIPYSIHDIKWMSYFSTQNDFNVYITCEHQNIEGLNQHKKDLLEQKNITVLPTFNDFSFKSPSSNKKTKEYLNRIIKEKDIQIVHVLFGSPQPLWLNSLKNVKKVITTRGSDVLLTIPNLMNNGWKKPHLKLLFNKLKKAFINADCVTSTSKKQAEKLASIDFRKEVELIKTGVEVEKISNINLNQHLPNQLKDKRIIFSPRYMSPVYNMEYQIEAISKLDRNVLENHVFVFIKGIDTEENYYDEVYKSLNKIKGLQFIVLEEVTQIEMWSIMKASELVYMVPKSDGTPNSALECMAAKTPLIIGDLDYNQELFEKSSWIAELNSPLSLTAKIENALNSYPVELLEIAFKKVNKFGNRKVEMEKLKTVYLSLAQE